MLFDDENIITQTILLTLEGKLVSSCNSIFDTQPLVPYPASEGIPLLHSVLQTLQQQPNIKIHLPRIEANYPDLPGFYDFTFEVVTIKNQAIIRWIIYDFTNVYEALQRKQQQSHENDIKSNKD